MEKFKELIEGTTLVLVDYFATWCGPCKAMHPILEDLKKQLGDKVKIVKIDIDTPANRSLVETYKIQSVPTLMIFREGKMQWRQSGVMQVAQLKELIAKYAK